MGGGNTWYEQVVQGLVNVIGNVHYGGRVTSQDALRCLEQLLLDCLTAALRKWTGCGSQGQLGVWANTSGVPSA